MSGKLETRRASESDREFARRAHHAAYRDVVERQFGPWDEPMQDRFFDNEWDPEKKEVILAGDVACGYCVVEYRRDDIHLRELVIHPEHQGRGIGTWLLRRVQDEALASAVAVRLGTLRENRALRLYQRLGFREIGTTDTHVLMEWRPVTTEETGGSCAGGR